MGREEVVIWARRGLLYAGKPTCRKAAPSKNDSIDGDSVIGSLKLKITVCCHFHTPVQMSIS